MQRRKTLFAGLIASSMLVVVGLANGAEPTTVVFCAPRDAEVLPVDAPVMDVLLCGLPQEAVDATEAYGKGFKVDLDDDRGMDSKDRAQFMVDLLDRQLTEAPGGAWFLETQPVDWDPESCWVGELDSDATDAAEAVLEEAPHCLDLTLFDDNGVITEQEPL